MASSIVVRVEITDAGFAQEYEVDPTRPLVDLVRRIANEENIPLVTRSGRPLAWEAEGPDWRPGKEGRTDLTRTQTLTKITERVLEEQGPGAPLFMISLTIPGAAEAIGSAREEAKLQEIKDRLDQREAEREAERKAALGAMETAEHMTLPPDDVVTERMPSAGPPPPTPPNLSVEDQPTQQAAPPQRPAPGGVPDVPGKPTGRPVEQRIRRADRSGGGTGRRAAASGTGRKAAASGTGRKAAASGTGRRAAGGGTGRRGAAKGGKGKGKKGAAAVASGPPMGLIIGGAAAAFVAVVIIVAVTGKEEPEPTPTPVATAPPEVVIDIPIATPEPTPEPVVVETPPPVKFNTFFSTAELTRNTGGEIGARISSFAKSEVKMGYRATGPHTTSLKNRFTLKVGESSTTLTGSKSKTCKGAPTGSETKVSIHWKGDTVTARVGGSRCGPVPVSSSSGFAAWKFDVGGSRLNKLWASAPEE